MASKRSGLYGTPGVNNSGQKSKQTGDKKKVAVTKSGTGAKSLGKRGKK